jgi:ribosomal protein L37AE/L43A
MDGIIWLLLALILALVALGVVLVGIRRRAPKIKLDHCASCRTPISLRRVSFFRSHMLLGEWVCPHCGTRMNKSGRNAGTAT